MTARDALGIAINCLVAGSIVSLGIVVSTLTEGKLPSPVQWLTAGCMGALAALKDLQSRLAEPPAKG